MQPTLTPADIERLMSKVDKTSTCWLWTGSTDSHGYGSFKLTTPEGRFDRGAHRLVWIALKGEVPEGLVLDHLCRVRHCVNPDHLRVVTHTENVLIGISPSAINARKTHCKHGHEFTPENTAVSPRTGERTCRKCRLRWSRNGNAKLQKNPKACATCGAVVQVISQHMKRVHGSGIADTEGSES